MQDLLSVIIPVYNEEKTITRVIDAVLARKEVCEVIVVDDGSKDGSYAKVTPYISRRVRLLRHIRNRGKGAAIKTGIMKARGKYLLIQDADLELSPSDYPRLLTPLVEQRVDFVIGDRWKNHTGHFVFQAGNYLLTLLLNLLYGMDVADLYCGYKVGPTKIWKKIKIESKRFEIEAEIVAKLGLLGVKLCNVDVKYTKPRSYREGKKIMIGDAIKGGIMLLKLRFFS